jgi:hypothetical protein
MNPNDEHLASAMTWLRLKLERLSTEVIARAEVPAEAVIKPAVTAADSSIVVSRNLTWGERLTGRISKEIPAPIFTGSAITPASPTTALPKPRAISDQELQEAETRMRDLEANPTPPRLKVLGDRFGLSDFEQDLLLLCAAMELDTRIANLCARAQDNPQRPYPTFALAFALFNKPAWDVLSPQRPLRYWRLLEISTTSTQPVLTSPLRSDERMVAALKGLDNPDERLLAYFTPLEIEANPKPLPESQQASLNTALHALRSTPQHQMLPAIQLLGNDAGSQTLIARRIAQSLNVPVYRVALEHLPSNQELETLARLWQRDSLIAPIALLIDTLEANEQHESLLRRFVERGDGVIMIGTREIRPSPGRETISVDVNKPSASEQRETWTQLLGTDDPNAPGRLSAQFNLGLNEIERIHQRTQLNLESVNPDPANPGPTSPNLASLNLASPSPAKPTGPSFDSTWDACRAAARPRLDALAQRLEVKANWDRFVLPDNELQQLKLIADHVRTRNTVYEDWGFAQSMNRGLGINALFAGESGTGKTMAAEVIANELRLDLYRIDLANVVSKYIGETEKNLRKIFDAAEDGGMILFFDEADALFGKRSEVKDSHDRYANIEINYLLQRIESFRGLAILASNLKTSLDSAFVRRLRFIINFPFPGLPERQRLWERVFPAETPQQDLHPERLARFDLTGASIHNAAMHAAFLAAREQQPVSMTHILEAIRNEYRKLERPINKLDFQWTEPNAPTQNGAFA